MHALFSLLTRPRESSLIPRWIQKIRERLAVVDANIIKLQREKQSLLSLLWEEHCVHAFVEDESMCRLHEEGSASRTSIDIHKVDEDSSANKNVVNSWQPEDTTGNEMNLDQEEYNNESSFEDASCVLAFNGNDDGTHQQSFQGNSFNVGEEPASLSQFNYRSPHNTGIINGGAQDGSCPATPPKNRIPRTTTLDEIQWENLPVQSLKRAMNHFGMKGSIGGKTFMISQLNMLTGYLTGRETNTSSLKRAHTEPLMRRASENKEGGKKVTREDKFKLLSEMIKQDSKLYEKILCSEIVDPEEIMAKARNTIDPGISIDLKLTRDFLEHHGVSFLKNKKSIAKKNNQI